MDSQVYTISQAAKEVKESTSVLRYWEDVLGIRISRNEKGYRCYTGYDIQLFLNIKELKKRGLKLDAIREVIPQIYRYGPGAPKSKTRLLEDSGQCWDTENEIVEESVQTADEELVTEILSCEEIPSAEISFGEKDTDRDALFEEAPVRMPEEDPRITEFQNIMEKLIAQGLKERNQEELRVRKLDEKIRFRQQSMKQVAATREIKQMRGKGRRRRNRKKSTR